MNEKTKHPTPLRRFVKQLRKFYALNTPKTLQQGMIQAAAGFNQKVRDKIDKLANDRTVGRKSAAGKTILFVLIGKHHKLYYRKIGSKIRIVCFFDTRQDPRKSPY